MRVGKGGGMREDWPPAALVGSENEVANTS